MTEVLDAQRRRTALYAAPRAERSEKPVRVGSVIQGEEDDADQFERPDELKIIRAKVAKKRSGRYPPASGW